MRNIILTSVACVALLGIVPAYAGGSHDNQSGHPANNTSVNANLNGNWNANTNRNTNVNVNRSSARSASYSNSRSNARSQSSANNSVQNSNTYEGSNESYTGSYEGNYSGSYVGGDTNIDARSAPSFAVVPPAAGGQCGVVGFAAAGSGLGGGGGFGPSWESTNCRKYYIAVELAHMGYKAEAVSIYRKMFSDVDEAFKDVEQQHAQAADRPAWCDKVDLNGMGSASYSFVHQHCGM